MVHAMVVVVRVKVTSLIFEWNSLEIDFSF